MSATPSGNYKFPVLQEEEAASSDGAEGQIIPFFHGNWGREKQSSFSDRMNTFHVLGT